MAGAEFGISLADSAHIMTILRDTLYSDKIMAILREYSANAWDSHRTSGKAELPIEVHIPTATDPLLTIRDFGTGLSREDVFNVYTQYGASTKRDSDQAVGMLGIGCKSGFAYSDTFNVTSWFGGTKSVYSAMLDPSDKGIISLIGEEPCGDETGIMIEIPVKNEDISEFTRKAQSLFAHFDPRPKINVELREMESPIGKFKSGVLFTSKDYGYGEMVAVMGCVPYRISLDQVTRFEEGLPQFMTKLNGLLYFDIGEVHINASREELKYSDKTKRAILDKLNELVTDYVKTAVQKIADQGTTPWTKRLMAQQLRMFDNFVPSGVKMYTDYSINLSKFIPSIKIGTSTNPDGKQVDVMEPLFWLSDHRRQRSNALSVVERARVIVKDDGRTMKGFDFNNSDIIVHRGKSRPSHADVTKAVHKMLKDADATGIKVTKTSEIEWENPRGHVERAPNIKHGHKFFKYVHGNLPYKRRGYSKAKTTSDCWSTVGRTATKNDVYVEIEHFRADYDLPDLYTSDSALAAEFGMTMPDVWGYKVTKKDPSQKRPGLEYREWRKVLAKEIMETAKFTELLERHNWSNILESGYHQPKIDTTKLVTILGEDHMICKFLVDRNTAITAKSSGTSSRSEAVEKVQRLIGKFTDDLLPATRRMNEIYAKYPIFSCQNVQLVWIGVESDMMTWTDYVKMVDQKGAA